MTALTEPTPNYNPCFSTITLKLSCTYRNAIASSAAWFYKYECKSLSKAFFCCGDCQRLHFDCCVLGYSTAHAGMSHTTIAIYHDHSHHPRHHACVTIQDRSSQSRPNDIACVCREILRTHRVYPHSDKTICTVWGWCSGNERTMPSPQQVSPYVTTPCRQSCSIENAHTHMREAGC